MLRESLAPGSRNLNLMVTPADVPALDGTGNGANSYIATWREVADGPMAEWPGGSRFIGLTYPNMWLWLFREGQTFTAVRSTNGRDWLLLARATFTNSFPSRVFVGVATTSANNGPGFATRAAYANVGPGSVATPAPPRLNISSMDDTILVSWFNVPGFSLEFAQGMWPAGSWSPATNRLIQVNGTNQMWFDPGAVSQEFFRLRRP